VFVAYGLWLASRDRALSKPVILGSLAAPVAGIAAYFLTRLLLDIPLFPPRGRYTTGGISPVLVNAAMVIANVLAWALAAWFATTKGARREPAREVAVMAAAAVAAVLPSLMLPWRSPNFLYPAAPIVALGFAHLIARAARPRRASAAAILAIALMLAGTIAMAWRAGAYKWGPYTESSIAQWTTFPRHGGRVVWFDLDSRAGYGGLARTVGPGDRLAYALRLVSGDPSIEAGAFVSVLVGPPYTPQAGDELYVHTQGHLQRVAAPPSGPWYQMP
jgi:hypothetical protein